MKTLRTVKPWEETWEVQRYVIEMAGDAGRHLGQFVDDDDDPDNPSCDRDRAQLAAAAPEMARLLLACMWNGHDSDSLGDGVCLGCGVEQDEEHTPDCVLIAVLRKAGVLP